MPKGGLVVWASHVGVHHSLDNSIYSYICQEKVIHRDMERAANLCPEPLAHGDGWRGPGKVGGPVSLLQVGSMVGRVGCSSFLSVTCLLALVPISGNDSVVGCPIWGSQLLPMHGPAWAESPAPGADHPRPDLNTFQANRQLCRKGNAAHEAGGAWPGEQRSSHRSWSQLGGHRVTSARMLYGDRQVPCLQ